MQDTCLASFFAAPVLFFGFILNTIIFAFYALACLKERYFDLSDSSFRIHLQCPGISAVFFYEFYHLIAFKYYFEQIIIVSVMKRKTKIEVWGGKRVRVEVPSGRKVRLEDFEPIIKRIVKRHESSS